MAYDPQQSQMQVYASPQSTPRRPRSSRQSQGGFTDQDAQNQQYTAEQAATQFQSQYGRAPSQQDIQRFQSASGWSGQGNISQQQMQQGMQAIGGFMQQEGNLGAVPFAQVGQPAQMQTFEQSRQQGQQLVGQYQPTPQTQQMQQQAGQTAMNQMQQGPMQFSAPTGGPMPDFGQQQGFINYLANQQGPQSNQGLFNQQQQAVNAIQGMQAGAFQPQGGGLTGQAAGQASQLMQAGPLTGQFQAPEPIAQAERNRILQAVMGNPDVFGQQQQAQMAEQQKEQLLAQQREAEGRLGQLMAQRGLSARGGAELAGQMGLQENLISGLLAGQRDIALRSAEANRAAQLGAVNAVTGAQQSDMGLAQQAFQTQLQGAQANRQAQTQATELGAQLGQQQFQQGLQSGQFAREGQIAALQGASNLAQQQMQQNQQSFNQGLAAFQANLGAQGQFGQQQLSAAQLANQLGQQGFQNYLAQAGLGLQGFGAAEAANAARAQFGQQNYMDALRYNLQARGQEQDYAQRVLQENRMRELGMLG